MKKFTIYYINKNGDRIALYHFDDYDEARFAFSALVEINEKFGGDVIWHLIYNIDETVLL